MDAAPGPQLLRWTSDGNAIIYILTRGGVSNIWEHPIDGSPARQLSNFTSDLIYWFDRSRDGTFVLARGNRTTDVVLIRTE